MRIFVSEVVLCFVMLVFGTKMHAEDKPPDFRVTIIAVTKFEDPNLSGQDEQDLNDANIEAANKLKSYFETFQITPPPDLYILPSETSQDSLRNWLFHDLRLDSRQGVHLVFILTHGFADLGPDARTNQSEIYLATSDTYKDIIPGRAIRGGDFVDAFHFMPKRATVFLFLDTCGSGAIDNEYLRRLLQNEPDFASRVLIIAAANSDELAYRARFTNTLLNIWQAKAPTLHCGPMHIEKFLTDSLRTVQGVSPDVKQTVRVVAPLSPDFCIENFNYTQRFLMLYNASSGDIAVTLQARDESDPEPTIDLKEYEMAPVSELRPTSYTIVARRKLGDGQVDQHSNFVGDIDLSSVPAKVKVLFSSDELDEADAQQLAAQYLDSRQILPSISESLRQSSGTAVALLSNNLRARLLEVEAQQSSLSGAAQALATDLERKRQIAEAARHKQEKAIEQLGQAAESKAAESKATENKAAENQAAETSNENKAAENKAHTADGIGEQKSEVERTTAEFKAANGDYDRTAREEREIHDRIEKILPLRSQVLAELNRIEGRKKSANEFAAKRSAAIALENSASTELKSVFPDLQRTDRGLVAAFTGVNEEEAAKSDRMLKFVNISNKYPMLNVEIELLQGGESSIENQVAIRARAAKFMQTFREIGLKTENAVARGFIVPGKLPLTVDLIMSQP